MNKEESSKTIRFIIVQCITLLRIPLAFLFSLFLFSPLPEIARYTACIITLIFVESTDFFDGLLARKFGVVNELGALLDPYADSISRIIIYFSLAMSSLIHIAVPLTMAFRDITVAYARIIFAVNKKTVSAKISGKIKAVVQAGFSFIILLQPLYWQWTGKITITIFSWIVCMVTLLSMIEYSFHGIQAFRHNYKKFYKK
jgi:CDP-diacylglycerol---glycerol-3-phosphate 3-phosphatidyltransferase